MINVTLHPTTGRGRVPRVKREENNMTDFKVGDTVRIVEDVLGDLPKPVDTEGEVIRVFEFDPEQEMETQVDVRFGDDTEYVFDARELVVV